MDTRSSRVLGLVLACSATSIRLSAQTAADFARADSAIVRLQPSAFPQLPAGFRGDLERRGCRIPQSFAASRPHNVTRGALTSSAPNDWAALCSVAGESRILVYRPSSAGSGATVVDSLGPERDATYLQTGVQEGSPWRIGFSRRIGIASPAVMRSYSTAAGNRTSPERFEHAGIEDSYLEKASRIFYFSRGRWRTLPGAD